MEKLTSFITPIVMSGSLDQVADKASNEIYMNIAKVAGVSAVVVMAFAGLCWMFGQKQLMKITLIGLFGGLALIGVATVVIAVWKSIVGL